jgi:hypothetical protein
MGIDLNFRFIPELLRDFIIASSLPVIQNVRPGTGTTNLLALNGQTSLQPYILEGLNVPPVAR